MSFRACGLSGLVLIGGITVFASVASAGDNAKAPRLSEDQAVTIIGLGHMGAVLAQSPRDAIAASPPTVVSLINKLSGEDVRAAATTYLALWNYYFVALAGYFEGAALAQTAGVRVDDFRSLTGTMMQKFSDAVADANRRINTRDYKGDQAPVDEYLEFFEQIRQTAVENGLGHRGPEALIGYVESTQKAGNGDKDIAVLFKTIGGRD